MKEETVVREGSAMTPLKLRWMQERIQGCALKRERYFTIRGRVSEIEETSRRFCSKSWKMECRKGKVIGVCVQAREAVKSSAVLRFSFCRKWEWVWLAHTADLPPVKSSGAASFFSWPESSFGTWYWFLPFRETLKLITVVINTWELVPELQVKR